jgi:hypothetical protein
MFRISKFNLFESLKGKILVMKEESRFSAVIYSLQ